MKKILFPLICGLLLIIMNSCRMPKSETVYDYYFEGILDENYKSLYVVDTITLKSPYLVYYKGSSYVVPRSVWESTKTISAKFFKRTDIFLFSYDYMIDGDMRDTISDGDYDRYSRTREFIGNYYMKKRLAKDTLYVAKFKMEEPVFILGLINIYWYNFRHAYGAIDIIPSPLKYRDSRNLYYKVLYLYPAGRDEESGKGAHDE